MFLEDSKILVEGELSLVFEWLMNYIDPPYFYWICRFTFEIDLAVLLEIIYPFREEEVFCFKMS